MTEPAAQSLMTRMICAARAMATVAAQAAITSGRMLIADIGYNLGNGGGEVPKEVRQRAEESAHDRWTLLLQMEYGVWATYGFLYFYITKEDLAARRFDRIWLIFQCD